MNKYLRWGLVALVILALGGYGIYNLLPHTNKDLEESPSKEKGKKSRTLNVRAVIVNEQTLSDGLYVSGNLIADEEVQLAFETSGKLTHIYFSEGAHVQHGQLLAKINDAPLQAQLRKLQAQQKLVEDRLFRQNALLAKEAVSKEAFQEAQTDLATLKAEMDMIEAQIAQTELRAPFDGIVGLRKVSVGAYVSPTTEIALFTKIRPLKVELSVPERYAGMLKPGAPISFSVEGDLERRDAKVYATDSRVDSETRAYKVRALYDNPGGKLLPGRYVNVSLTTQQHERALAVPSEAIVSEMGIDKVYVYRNGKAEPAEIVKGLRTETLVQVLKGLSIGDTVITSGTMQLRTGQQVTLDAVNRQ